MYSRVLRYVDSSYTRWMWISTPLLNKSSGLTDTPRAQSGKASGISKTEMPGSRLRAHCKFNPVGGFFKQKKTNVWHMLSMAEVELSVLVPMRGLD